jgi:pimeloyl-ACP methyl ester carboxylesterase
MDLLVRRLVLPLVLLAVVLHGCGSDKHPLRPPVPGRGEVVQSQLLGTMTVSDLQQTMAARNIQVPFTLTFSIASHALQYYTVDSEGRQTIVSGALIVPQGAADVPLVSIQHGTESKRDLVASVSPLNSTEGTVGLIMASMGYAVVVPDYPGFGVSSGIHPYLHAKFLTPCVVDLIRAARSHSAANGLSLNGQVFLTGYSEGGFVTLAAQKEIEEQHAAEFGLVAVAPLSGPYDLAGMMKALFHAGSYVEPAYIAYILTAYDNGYGWGRLDDFFQAPYAAMMPGLFDGSKTWGQLSVQLPSTFADLMSPTFVSNINAGGEPAVLAAIQENTLLDWTPLTPLHFFHGDADEIVPISNALSAVNAFTTNGASSVQLTTIPGGTHESSGPVAIVGAIQWFESLRGASRGSRPLATRAAVGENAAVAAR